MNVETTNLESVSPGAPARSRARAAPAVLEVFPSLQGEGLFAGEAQTFVRLRGCPLRCRYCDTPGSWSYEPRGTRVVAVADDGSRTTATATEGATAFRVMCWVAAAEGGRPRTISLTGGEPLEFPELVLELTRLRGERRVHLETAGAHPDALARVLDSVQHTSLDLKLPSTLDAPATGDETALRPAHAEPMPDGAEAWRDVRRRVLALVRGRDAAAKIVLVAGTPMDELAGVLDDVADLAPELPVFLQPASPVGPVAAPTHAELDRAVDLARDRELRVRALPQVHRLLRIP